MIGEIEFQWSPSYKINDIISYISKILNKYDYPCKENKEARKLIKTDFKRFLKESKFYTKKYAKYEEIKFKQNLNLIEKSVDELSIKQPE